MIYKLKNETKMSCAINLGNICAKNSIYIPKDGYFCIEIPDSAKVELKVYLTNQFKNGKFFELGPLSMGLTKSIIPTINKVLSLTAYRVFGSIDGNEEFDPNKKVEIPVEEPKKRRRRHEEVQPEVKSEE